MVHYRRSWLFAADGVRFIMERMRKLLLLVVLAAPFVAAAADRSQPPLFFREDWTETPPNLPVTDADLTNKDLTVSRWGPGGSVPEPRHRAIERK